jgi:hypothetical protein
LISRNKNRSCIKYRTRFGTGASTKKSRSVYQIKPIAGQAVKNLHPFFSLEKKEAKVQDFKKNLLKIHFIPLQQNNSPAKRGQTDFVV